MKARLAAGDVQGAVIYFSDSTKQTFEYNFNLLHDHLPSVVEGFRTVTLVKETDTLAEYNLEGVQGGQGFSFYLVFEKGADGIWRIKFF
ncbi:MAG: hypothetical protein HY911_02240 [Desulfobacterales bacterium]|nr:hypothetical protein [Desulfobacterales bacterium]